MFGEWRIAVWWAAERISSRWAGSWPVVATTSGSRRSTQVLRMAIVPAGLLKSITHSGRTDSGNSAVTGTPIAPTPATTPASCPSRGLPGASMAATMSRPRSSWARATSRWPIRPQAPWIAMGVFTAALPCSTAPCGKVGHAYSSIALTISSRSLGTCTARLANATRLTPRFPRYSSNVFGSLV